MMKIQLPGYIRLKLNSFFLRLVTGFLCIILILVLLTSYALSVSQNNMRQEIVKYNTLMLNNTMENYEKHFEMIKKQMYLFYYTEPVQRLQREPSYPNYPIVIKEIQSWVANPYLFIGNIIFYSKEHNFVIEKDSSTKPDLMFGVFYESKQYSLDFWNKQFEEAYSDRIFPADSFYTNMFRNRQVEIGEFIPIVFKMKTNQDFYMVVFLDARKMYEAFHQTINEDFTIYNENGDTVFKQTVSDSHIPPEALKPDGGDAFILDNKYHFYTKGIGSGMTYIHRLPVEQMASQTRLNFTMVVVIVVVILFSILISFLLASRMNNPLKKLVHSIRGTNEDEPYHSNIHEFDMIGGQLSDKKKMQKQWAFLNYLKDIRGHENDKEKLEFTDKAFVFILFHVIDKKNASWVHASFQSWLYYIKVFIEVKLSRSFSESLTIQIEHNQILSQVFMNQEENLRELVEEMKAVFDQDVDSGTVTIAISSPFNHFHEVPDAYREVHERFENRRLVDETQIVDALIIGPEAFGFTQEQDIEFQANLKEGHMDALTVLMERFFTKWSQQDVPAAAWIRFSEALVERIRQIASSSLISPMRLDGIMENPREKIQRCISTKELEHLLLGWLKMITEMIRVKKEKKDAITSFVMEYVNDHLAEDIYLDILAEKLNISSGYLSSYFKEKTGTNIVEYINEVRITKATMLLTEPSLRIQDVAEAVGYRNIASFNRMFKKYTGLKPSDYRKSQISNSDDTT